MIDNKWLKTVNQASKNRYALPEGWLTKTEVAEKLGCAPDKVPTVIAPAIETKAVESKKFMVWNDDRRIAVNTVCYRIAGEDHDKPPSHARHTDVDPITKGRVMKSLTKNPEATDTRLSKNLLLPIGVVRAARSELGL